MGRKRIKPLTDAQCDFIRVMMKHMPKAVLNIITEYSSKYPDVWGKRTYRNEFARMTKVYVSQFFSVKRQMIPRKGTQCNYPWN